MKKNEVFTFTAPNGVEVTAVCVAQVAQSGNEATFLCYSQNRLFTMQKYQIAYTDEDGLQCYDEHTSYGEVLVDYCIFPDYDDLLKAYSDHYIALAELSGM